MTQSTKLIYTTADSFHDIRGTRVLESKAGMTTTGHRIRLVGIPEDIYAEQIRLYVAALCMVMDEQEWKIEQQFGNVTSLQEEATA